MLRITCCMSADGAEKYFDAALKRSDYYAKEFGLWGGKGAERLGLKGEIEREDFVALIRNRVPGTELQEKLTARDNTTRQEWKNGEWQEVANRRAGYDFTWSVPKSVSIYLAASGDELVERFAHRAFADTMRELEAEMRTRVRAGGLQGDRATGEMVYSTFVHRETRPIAGRSDPHFHLHCFVHNCTWDEQEGRWKAGEFSVIKAHAPWYQEVFHDRLAQNLTRAGYGIRRTEKSWELACIRDEDVEQFSRRTRQVEEEARNKDKQLWAGARALAKEQGIDLADAYAIKKGELGGRTRKGKGEATLSPDEQRQEWRELFGPERWDSLTPASARSLESTGFLEPELAKQKALEHVYRSRSVANEVSLAAEYLKQGVGTVSREEARGWVRTDGRFIESTKAPGKFTTQQIVAEETRIRELVLAGRERYQALSQGRTWTVTDPKLDAGQQAAVKLVMKNRDMAVAAMGKPGSGKSSAIRQAADAVEEMTGARPVVIAPSARAVDAVGKAANVEDGMTVDRLMIDPRMQKAAAGRVIFCDESSFLDNRRAEWLLTFAKDHGCRVVMWGDPRQHDAVERGTPFADLLDSQALERAELEKIYRQRNPEILAAVEAYHAGRWQEGFQRVERAGIVREAQSEASALRELVDESLEHYRAGRDPLVIALRHRHGEQIAALTREKLKAEGLIGAEDRRVTRLEHVDLSDEQRADPVHYRPGMVVQFHRRAEGGYRSGHQYEVTKVEGEQITTCDKDGKERPLPLRQAESFQVYRQATLAVAEGDRLLITQNQSRVGLWNGDLVRVHSVDGDRIRLDNGRVLDASKGLHLRQGYTLSSQASQGHQSPVTLAFLPTSAENQVDAKQMLVTLSRAIEEVKLYTDSTAVLREAATRSGERETAHEHIPMKERTPAQEMTHRAASVPDLQEGAVKGQHTLEPEAEAGHEMSEFERALRRKVTEKYPDLTEAQAERLEPRICKVVKEYERQRAAEREHTEQAAYWHAHQHEQRRGMEMER